MRFLHTADWHIGRPFAVSRLAEQEAVLAEILDIASANRVDCVLVCGDIFDSRVPSAEAERAVFTFFAELVKRGMAAIAIAGNHDHPKRLDALRGLLDPLRIFIRTEPAPPEQGGIVEFAAGGEVARIAALPYVSERHIVDACKLMGPEEKWHSDYRENVADMMNLLARSFTASTINIVMGHIFAVGAETSGSEWRIHTSLPYEIHPARFPPAAQYIALGDLHRPQEIAGPVPCRYSGSPIQLDFGEQGQRKSVVLVEAHPGRPVHIETTLLTAGRNLREIEGTIEEIEAEAGQLSGDYLKVTVVSDGPVPGLAERVRSRLPDALQIRPKSAVAREEPIPAPRPQGKPQELFQDFYKRQHGGEPDAELLKAFNELYEEAMHAAE
jgi:DNA repair protein SbcD/Mre11